MTYVYPPTRMRKTIGFVSLILLSSLSHAQKLTISGYIKDAETGESLQPTPLRIGIAGSPLRASIFINFLCDVIIFEIDN